MRKHATSLVLLARKHGLNLNYQTITKGDGSCYFHAIAEQMTRREVIANMPPETLELAKQPQLLRTKIVDMMRHPENYSHLAEHINIMRENFLKQSDLRLETA